MMESPILKSKGAEWFTTADAGCTPSLSKSSLGSFMYEVLKVGAQIGEVWPFNPDFDRSSVYFTVFMTHEQKESLESRTKFRFKRPAKVHLN